MAKQIAFLNLPAEVRRNIYARLFEPVTVHANFAWKYSVDPSWDDEPESEFATHKVHPALNITATSRVVHDESIPIFFQRALFDLSECCSAFIADGRPNIPIKILKKLHRIRGSYELLVYLRLACIEWLQRTPWPCLNVDALPLTAVVIELKMSEDDFRSDYQQSCTLNLAIVHQALRTPRRFKMEVHLTICHKRKHATTLIHIRDDLSATALYHHPSRTGDHLSIDTIMDRLGFDNDTLTLTNTH